MDVLRTVLLAGSESRWLRQRAPRLRFLKTAATRFMPGERIADALAAASRLRQLGIGAVLTQLGENVTDAATAHEVVVHYSDVLTKIHAGGLDCEISVKPTQLGVDVDRKQCLADLRLLVERANRQGTFVWIDMEQHTYVDSTLDLFRRLRSEFPSVGVCLQAYLYRTADDLESLVPLGGGIRLVKGAYREPAGIAFPRKRDVDDNFLALARRLLSPEARSAGLRAVFGTHDHRLIKAIQDFAGTMSMPREATEFHLLYGIQRALQAELAADRYRVRVLISYGEQWFPWYMRRLAERPANVLFVARAMLSK